jgi:chitinase
VTGIDIDWEYPGQAQIQDNIVSSNDSASLLAFFQLLRAKLGADKLISAAVTDYTFLNSQGGRMTDVSQFGKVLDYILIM